MDILWWVVILAFFVGLFMFLDSKYLKIGQNKDLTSRILLFEKVGDEKVFKKMDVAPIKQDDKLGFYVKLNKKISITVADPKDFFYDSEHSRCLEVIKFGPDDYRPVSRMDKNIWGRLVEKERPVLDDAGEPIPILDEEGQPILDEEGQPIFQTETVQSFEKYDEPKGVSQLSREGIRFNRAFQKRMEELKKEKQSWWAQHGVQVMSVAVIILFMIFMTHNQNNYYKNVKEYSTEAVDAMNDATDAINKPHWAEDLIKSVQREDAESKTPRS
jgi:uncharacterized membrane protein